MKIIKTNIRNVYYLMKENKKILTTKNLVPGQTVYKENLYKTEIGELREWIPYKSKLAASILKGLDISFINRFKKILYLGVSTGTTVSHISDIVENYGIIYGVEIAPRVMLEFMNRVATTRENIYPLFFDARRPEDYIDIIDTPVDMVYCDVAQPDQTKIALENSLLTLKHGGILLYAIKARSIDATRKPDKIYKEECKKIEKEGFDIIKVIDLTPYERDHAMVYAKLK
jgi:fibrillarin-like pre-rRNA processing protein